MDIEHSFPNQRKQSWSCNASWADSPSHTVASPAAAARSLASVCLTGRKNHLKHCFDGDKKLTTKRNRDCLSGENNQKTRTTGERKITHHTRVSELKTFPVSSTLSEHETKCQWYQQNGRTIWCLPTHTPTKDMQLKVRKMTNTLLWFC